MFYPDFPSFIKRLLIIGTALGARVGQWAENLFGKKEEAKK